MKPLHIAGSQISNSTMASAYLFFTTLIACSIFLTTFSSDAAENGRFGGSRIEAQKVTLSVYYETLCPFCATFIVKNLAQIFDNNLITILNLRLVPWGKASTNSSKNSTVCQVPSLTLPFQLVLQFVCMN